MSCEGAVWKDQALASCGSLNPASEILPNACPKFPALRCPLKNLNSQAARSQEARVSLQSLRRKQNLACMMRR
jgi:hypothetical protein